MHRYSMGPMAGVADQPTIGAYPECPSLRAAEASQRFLAFFGKAFLEAWCYKYFAPDGALFLVRYEIATSSCHAGGFNEVVRLSLYRRALAPPCWLRRLRAAH
jgi:hypothetical protein